MVALPTLVCTVLGLLLETWIGFCCLTIGKDPPKAGYYCLSETYINLTNIPEHLCIHRCMTSTPARPCTAVSYNIKAHYCILAPTPCYTCNLTLDVDFVYIPLKPGRPTVTWVPYNTVESYPQNTVGDASVMVGRAQVGGDLLVGLIDTSSFTFYYYGGSTATVYDVLVINPTCSYTWISYEASDGPVPAGAVEGGVKDGATIFVTKTESSSGTAFGYYDVQTEYHYIVYLGGSNTMTKSAYLLVVHDI